MTFLEVYLWFISFTNDQQIIKFLLPHANILLFVRLVEEHSVRVLFKVFEISEGIFARHLSEILTDSRFVVTYHA